jgi:dipeptidyl aminopeptidase/acylaminoacyl peptidase
MHRDIVLKKIPVFLLLALLCWSFLLFAGCSQSGRVSSFAEPKTIHPFSVGDMLAMDRISEQQVSPDGKQIVFTVRSTDLAADKGKTSLWLIEVDGSNLKQLIKQSDSDCCPKWSVNGKSIYFLSTRSGSSQVWKIPAKWREPSLTGGGHAEQITMLPLDVSNIVLSPDGEHIAFSIEVFPSLSIEQTKQKLEKSGKRKSSGRIYEKAFVRHWNTWADGRRSHVFVMPANGKVAIDVMKDMDADCPSKPFGGSEEFCFTPDGKNIIFTARDVGPREPWSTDLDLYISPIDGSKKPVCLTEKNEATDTTPVFSPDGKTLAYLAMSRPGYESDRLRIMLKDWPTRGEPARPELAEGVESIGQERVLAENWDRSPASICWSKDGRKIYAVAENIGQKSLFAIDVQTGKAETIVEKGSVTGTEEASDRIIFGLDNLKSPLELYSVKTDGSDLKPITQINSRQLSAIEFGEFEQFSFSGWNNETVYGYVVKPADYKEGAKYPIAFVIHGGPQGSMGNIFHYRWNAQVFAGAGYGVVMIDFHGSTGYGQAFCDSIRGDWGGKPLVDLQKGLDAAIKKYPWLDSEKAGALGASFGGYMINWIEGNWPDRFRCLVNHAGDLDERMAYFDTEELWFTEWDHIGKPWDNPEAYEMQNPVNFVRNWKTPMLVTHGGKDFRVVETQGLGTFNALQRLGIPSRLLYFPDECHWIQRPSNSILWHETVISWLDRWLK